MTTNAEASGTANIVVRDIDGSAQMRAVEELQKQVWGIPDLDVVPLSHLVAAKAAGGVLLGAFDREILAGFVYGFVGYEHGRVAHHSQMLAVAPLIATSISDTSSNWHSASACSRRASK